MLNQLAIGHGKAKLKDGRRGCENNHPLHTCVAIAKDSPLSQRYRGKVARATGNDVILRLTGLSFPSGKATIQTEYFELLAAVQRAIYIFNDCYVVVEGHTDSTGEEEANLILSQERANAVRAYLIANSNSGIPATRISAEGYGESRPIATNMYEDGRAQNRRIDIVLQDARVGGKYRN